MGTTWRDEIILLGFSRIVMSFTDNSMENCSASHISLALDNPFREINTVKKKRELFQLHIPMSPSLFVLPHSSHVQLEEYEPHSLLTTYS